MADEPTQDNSTNSESSASRRTLADLKSLGTAIASTENSGQLPGEQSAVVGGPQKDFLGRAYATGRRKDAISRVWIKPGIGRVIVNGRESAVYFARPVLRMIINQPLMISAVGLK